MGGGGKVGPQPVKQIPQGIYMTRKYKNHIPGQIFTVVSDFLQNFGLQRFTLTISVNSVEFFVELIVCHSLAVPRSPLGFHPVIGIHFYEALKNAQCY